MNFSHSNHCIECRAHMCFGGQDTRVRREAVGSDNVLSEVRARGAFDDNENPDYLLVDEVWT